MVISVNPKNKLFQWGPIDGRPIYAQYWLSGFFEFNKKYKPGWPDAIINFSNEKFTVVLEYEELYNHGEKVFRKFIFDDKEFKKGYKKWLGILEKFENFISKSTSFRIKDLDRKSFYTSFKNWNSFYDTNFWEIGSLPEVANWGGEQLLSRELRKKIKNNEDFHYCLERLSAPEDLSFYQKEEIELLSLKKIKNKKLFQEKIKLHQEKYFWMLNSYHHTQILPVKYFKKILSSYSDKDAEGKIAKIKKTIKGATTDKFVVIEKFKLHKNLIKIGQRLAFCVWWQDWRKSYIFRANRVIDVFLQEISKRYKISFDELHYYKIKELEQMILTGKSISTKEIEERRLSFSMLYKAREAKAQYIFGERSQSIFAPYLYKKIDKKLNSFDGIVVNGGYIKGRVKMVLSSADIGKMKKGDILVAPMTSPDYIMALKKAGAVVTDEGGMTSHAAIVSRELGIPGIVGTKIATKVLKDGDLIEVDAIKGIIKKL